MATTDLDILDQIERAEGRARSGEVFIRDYTRGVKETLGAVEIGGVYYLQNIPYVSVPRELPGIPVIKAITEIPGSSFTQWW